MKDKIDYIKLLDFSNGKYSYKDFLMVKKWFNQIDKHQEAKNILFNQFDELLESESSEIKLPEDLFGKIEYQILKEEREKNNSKNLWEFYRRIAAILLFPIIAFCGYLLINNKIVQKDEAWVEIHSPEGARTEFFLPDGTKGWLNSASVLKYNPATSNSRTVQLEGEAYFDVAHDKDNIFVVNTKDLDIRVLGTKFNVFAYPDNDIVEIVLESGKIETLGKKTSFHKILEPNQKLFFNAGKRVFSINTVDPTTYTAWKDGYLILNNEALENAVHRIEKWYNVDIRMEDDMLKSYRFKATFKDEPLEEVLRLLSLTTPIDYTIEKRETDTNGIYKKRKINLKLKQ